jgi:GTP-binding protein HflX
VTEASVILHVLDISHPAMAEHFAATNVVLEELEAMDKPLLLALNKADLLDPATAAMIKRRGDWGAYEEVVAISARTGEGIASLLEAVERLTQDGMVRVELLLPYEQSGLESELRERGRVLALDYEDDGISVVAELSTGLAGRYARFRRPPKPTKAVRKAPARTPAARGRAG